MGIQTIIGDVVVPSVSCSCLHEASVMLVRPFLYTTGEPLLAAVS